MKNLLVLLGQPWFRKAHPQLSPSAPPFHPQTSVQSHLVETVPAYLGAKKAFIYEINQSLPPPSPKPLAPGTETAKTFYAWVHLAAWGCCLITRCHSAALKDTYVLNRCLQGEWQATTMAKTFWWSEQWTPQCDNIFSFLPSFPALTTTSNIYFAVGRDGFPSWREPAPTGACLNPGMSHTERVHRAENKNSVAR